MKNTLDHIISVLVSLVLIVVAFCFLFSHLKNSKDTDRETPLTQIDQRAIERQSSEEQTQNTEYWLTDDELSEALGRKVIDISSNEENYLMTFDSPPIEGLEVHFIDVGQGDATLINCQGHYMLIDGGDDLVGTLLQNYLIKHGVNYLDYVVMTHGDADHCGGLDVVISKFDIGTIFTCGFKKDTWTEKAVYDAIEYRGFDYVHPSFENTFSLGDADCYILGPVTYDLGEGDVNNASIVIKVVYGTTSFLFMGDAEEPEEASILSASHTDLHADVIKLGHHGSNTASSEEWIKSVNPSAAVVSCSLGNSFGHPHPSVLNYLRKNNISLYRTDEDGTVIAESDGINIRWNVPPSVSWKSGWDYQ